MKLLRLFKWLLALNVLVALLPAATPVLAVGPRVRVVHASPDAPAVDVWVDGASAFQRGLQGRHPLCAARCGRASSTGRPCGQDRTRGNLGHVDAGRRQGLHRGGRRPVGEHRATGFGR